MGQNPGALVNINPYPYLSNLQGHLKEPTASPAPPYTRRIPPLDRKAAGLKRVVVRKKRTPTNLEEKMCFSKC